MPDPREPQDDPYARVDYRRLIAWPERIRREGPFLRRLLDEAPERSAVDLGCGTGEHTRFFAAEGARAVGIDSSESMLARAAEAPLEGDVRFIEGDLRQADALLDERFGAAFSLGNTLVHLTEVSDLECAIEAASRLLVPGGRFLFQILNYERIFRHGIRYLPLNFRPADGGEVVFLRLMEPLPGGRVRFCPSSLRYDPAADPPLELVQSRIVELRGWTRGDLLERLDRAGFDVVALYGDMEGGPFDEETSMDLVVLSRKR